MKISNATRTHLNTARLLLESVASSLEKYEGITQTFDLPREDSVESVHRRLVQARQELFVASKDFDGASRFKYLSDQIEKHEV